VGGGSPSTLPTGEGAAATPLAGPLTPGQRWSVARKRAVVLRLIAGEPVELVSREISVPVFKLERWREKAEAALEGALRERETGAGGAELAAALQRVGELTMENELLRAKMGRIPGPLARRRWR
jgi:transposase